MSSISGLPTTTLPTTAPVGAPQAAPGVTPSILPYADLIDFGRQALGIDGLGLGRASSPENSSALVAEILAALEGNLDQASKDRTEGMFARFRTALSSIGDILANIGALSRKYDNLNAQIATKTSERNAAIADQAAATTRVGKAQADYDAAVQRLATANAAYAKADAQVTAAQKALDDKKVELAAAVAANAPASQITALQSAVAQLQATLDAAVAVRSTAADAVAAAKADMSAALKAKAAAQADLDDAIRRIAALTAEINTLQAEADTTFAAFQALQADMLRIYSELTLALMEDLEDAEAEDLIDAETVDMARDRLLERPETEKGTTLAVFGEKPADTRIAERLQETARALVAGILDVFETLRTIEDLDDRQEAGIAFTAERYRLPV